MVKNSKIHVLKPLPIFRTRPVSSGGRSDDLDGDDEDGRLVIDDLVDRDHLTNLKGSLISEVFLTILSNPHENVQNIFNFSIQCSWHVISYFDYDEV